MEYLWIMFYRYNEGYLTFKLAPNEYAFCPLLTIYPM